MVEVIQIESSDLGFHRPQIVRVLVAAFVGTKMAMTEESANDLFNLVSVTGVTFFLAKVDEEVCGVATGMPFTMELLADPHFATFATLGTEPGDYYFSIAGVIPSYRKTGAALKLLHAQLTIAAGKVGWARTWLENDPVLKTLPRIGFNTLTSVADRTYFRRDIC